MSSKQAIPSVAECPIFSALSDEEFGALQGLMVPIDYEAGELFSGDRSTLFGFAKALEETRLVFLERRRFLEFMEAHPKIFPAITEQLSRELALYESELVELAYQPMRVNLARLLIALACRFGVRREDGVEIEFSREDLAELTGTHIDTVIRTLAQLKEKELIATRYHKIKILDQSGLEEASHLTTASGRIFSDAETFSIPSRFMI